MADQGRPPGGGRWKGLEGGRVEGGRDSKRAFQSKDTEMGKHRVCPGLSEGSCDVEQRARKGGIRNEAGRGWRFGRNGPGQAGV